MREFIKFHEESRRKGNVKNSKAKIPKYTWSISRIYDNVLITTLMGLRAPVRTSYRKLRGEVGLHFDSSWKEIKPGNWIILPSSPDRTKAIKYRVGKTEISLQ